MQLKGSFSHSAFQHNLVSIPRGAVKSRLFLHSIGQRFKVSIPRGAVKSNVEVRTGVGLSLFQFQEVQLKVRLLYLRQCLLRLFQFQEVQLKDDNISDNPIVTEFQFQEVQLKVHYLCVAFGVSFVSIPRGAVKSSDIENVVGYEIGFNSKRCS